MAILAMAEMVAVFEFKFDPRYGNVSVSGELDGELTIAAANDIYITGYDPVDWRRPNKQDSWGNLNHCGFKGFLHWWFDLYHYPFTQKWMVAIGWKL